MKPKIRKARCKKVLAILNNSLETLKLLREETYPPVGDLDNGVPHVYAVVDYSMANLPEVMIPIDCVVFLKD